MRFDADVIEGVEGKIAFNSRYLLDVLAALERGKVALETASFQPRGLQAR